MAGGYGWSHSEDQLLASLNARSFKNFPAPTLRFNVNQYHRRPACLLANAFAVGCNACLGLGTAPGLHTLDSVCSVHCKNADFSLLRADNMRVFVNLVTSFLQFAANAVEGSFR